MSAMSTTPPTIPPHYTSVFDDEHSLHAGSYSSSTSHTSSPEIRPLEIGSPILEEEDETSSEAANEPLTPTEHHHPHSFTQKMNGADGSPLDGRILKQPPLILNTAATPPSSSAGKQDASTTPTPVSDGRPPKTPTAKRPASSSTDGSVIRAVSGFFRRSNSQSANAISMRPEIASNGSDPLLGQEHRRMSLKGATAIDTSAATTRSNTPPEPSSPKESKDKPSPAKQLLSVQEPKESDLFHNRKKNRSTTGFSFRDKFTRKQAAFNNAEALAKSDTPPRHRATSVDLDGPDFSVNAHQPEVQHMSRQPWGMVAETGIGLKSRRMSLSLPDDFAVDVIDLYSEYNDQSKIIGRRGKNVGKGATSNVRLMLRKGGCGEFYAVKEFRGKSAKETNEEYEKKVKSEYSIAKSAHHPNIVETFRLCTHGGRWNHVMEFCDQGDLFTLVSQKYLNKEDHQVDRLCLFKQLVQGLHYLHSNGIAHRDVKLENLLITKDSKLKITDFGVSEVFCGIHPGLRSAGGQCGKGMEDIRHCEPGMCGSPPYVAPEVVAKNGPYDPRPLDVWGAAVVMLCMCAGGCLWDKAEAGSSPIYDDLVKGWSKWNAKHSDNSDCGITESDYPHVGFFDKHINPPALRRLLLIMLNPDPSKRVAMADVANNRWLKNVECCQVDSYDDPTTIIDASKARSCSMKRTKVVLHNHLPPTKHHTHLVRLPGSTHM